MSKTIVFLSALLALTAIVNAASLSQNARAVDNTLYSRFLCRKKVNGFKAIVPGSCSRYYQCYNGASVELECPNYYDSEKNTCVDQNPGCIEDREMFAVPRPAAASAPCAGKASGYVVGENQAEWYKCCDNNVVASGVCPSGQEYNLALLKCDIKSSCGGDNEPCTTTPVPCSTTTTTCTTTTTTCSTATTTPAPTTTTTCTTTPAPTTTTTRTTTTRTTTTRTTTPATTTTTTCTTTTPAPTTTTTLATTTTTTCTTTTRTTTPATTTTTTCTTTTPAPKTTTCTTTTTTCTTTTTTCSTITTTTPKPCTTTPEPCPTTPPPVCSSSADASDIKMQASVVTIKPNVFVRPAREPINTISVLPPQSHESNVDLYIRYACRGKTNGFMLASLRSCNEYYICRNGDALRVSCGDKYFNSLKGQCDLPENTGCIQPYQQKF